MSAQLSIATGYTSISYNQNDYWRHGSFVEFKYTKPISVSLNYGISVQYSAYFDSKDYEFVTVEYPIQATVNPYQIIDFIPSIEYTLPDGPRLSFGLGVAYRNSSVKLIQPERINGQIVINTFFTQKKSGFEPTFRLSCGYIIDLSENIFLYPEIYLHNSFNRQTMRNPVNIKMIFNI
ncbi:MAG: hypothetical protein ACYC09_11210 [Bacteroidota bacterium]